LLAGLANANAALASQEATNDKVSKLVLQVNQANERESKLISRIEALEKAVAAQGSLTAHSVPTPAPALGIDQATVISIVQEAAFQDNIKGTAVRPRGQCPGD
jgi:hypothetical protein